VSFTRGDGGTSLSEPFDEGITTIVWRAADCCGNARECNQLIWVRDTQPPVISPGTGATLQVGVNEYCEYVLEDFRINGAVSITDNCSSHPNAQQTPRPGTLLTRGEYELVLNANDGRGNNSGVVYFLSVVDNMPPDILTAPAHVAMSADAGRCDALYEWAFAAADNCGAVSTFCSPSGHGKRFAIGDNSVNCSATDGSGNVASHAFTVTVEPTWKVEAYVGLLGFVHPNSFRRCVAFHFLSCTAGFYDATALAEMTFVGGVATKEITIPTDGGGGATCIPLGMDCAGATEVRHSLTEYVNAPDVRIEGRKFRAEWLGANALRLGNFDGDADVDVFDWIIWNAHFNGTPIPGVGDTGFDDCSGPPDPTSLAQRNSDATGDDRATGADYNHLFINHFEVSDEPTCCSYDLQSPDFVESPGPQTSVSVEELMAMGWEFATAFDYNGDGYVDLNDADIPWPDESSIEDEVETEPAPRAGRGVDQAAPTQRTLRIAPGRERR
jgi:hypothetical protein